MEKTKPLERIEALAEAREKATEGKWEERFDHDYYQAGPYVGVGPQKFVPDPEKDGNKLVACSKDEVEYFKTDVCRVESNEEDKQFIIQAANEILTLRDQIREVVEWIEGELDSIDSVKSRMLHPNELHRSFDDVGVVLQQVLNLLTDKPEKERG